MYPFAGSTSEEDVSLRSINLNLIPILQALLTEESVAKAADQVGLSQPAMSGALARLRVHFDDPILVRVGRSMRLTPRAQRMRRQLDQICAQVELLFQPETFDPATAEHSFVVAAPDYIVFLLSGVLLGRLRKEAPGIRIKFVDVPNDLPEWLEDTKIDLAVCANFAIWPELKYEHLFADRIVAAVSRHHALLGRARVTSTDLLEFPGLNSDSSVASTARDMKHITGIPSLDWGSQISSGQFMNSALLAASSPAVARVPASLVGRLANWLPLATIELSGEETEIDTGMFWAPIQHEALEHKWLRAIVTECLPSPFV
ncbi:MAG TPA: LysR family transcriptional regulator [Caulobacteraceae bacterium]|nr:LysR family transcriptional regulator [Caulobacteraceae bacterium]